MRDIRAKSALSLLFACHGERDSYPSSVIHFELLLSLLLGSFSCASIRNEVLQKTTTNNTSQPLSNRKCSLNFFSSSLFLAKWTPIFVAREFHRSESIPFALLFLSLVSMGWSKRVVELNPTVPSGLHLSLRRVSFAHPWDRHLPLVTMPFRSNAMLGIKYSAPKEMGGTQWSSGLVTTKYDHHRSSQLNRLSFLVMIGSLWFDHSSGESRQLSDQSARNRRDQIRFHGKDSPSMNFDQWRASLLPF